MSAGVLAGLLGEVTVLDVRWRLGAPPGLDDHLDAHIPGSAFVDLEKELCGPPGSGGRHPLPEPAVLQRALRAAGVRADRAVVAYDYGDGMAAARAWWTLRWAGHRRVSVLDGGFAAWQASSGPVVCGVEAIEPGDFSVTPAGMPVLTAQGAAELAGRGALLDARAPQRYRGETEPIDAVAGHIPGARNLPYADLVHADGTMRSDLRSILPLEAKEIGAYCGSGITAAHTVLALHEAGRDDAALYVGSWSEWIVDRSRPVGTGAA